MPGSADGINFIKEYDACLLSTCHLEELTHHSSTFSYVLLNELATDDTDEARLHKGYAATSVLLATALAVNVFPVPGGP